MNQNIKRTFSLILLLSFAVSLVAVLPMTGAQTLPPTPTPTPDNRVGGTFIILTANQTPLIAIIATTLAAAAIVLTVAIIIKKQKNN